MISKSNGFSMLELMIAVMVLAIGLLGMAAMQAVALSSNQEAQFRVSALSIAEDLASRMRANRAYVNATADKYPLMPANAAGFNVYSTADFNATPADPVAPNAVLPCGDPDTAADLAELTARLNCRANEDVVDIRRQLNPDNAALSTLTARSLPADTVMYVDCTDNPTLDYNGAADTDPCSPGSVYTIYVIWPTSAGRAEAGQLDAGGNNRPLINSRCSNRLIAAGTPFQPRDAGCVIMDIVP